MSKDQYGLVVLIPSRGLPFAECMQALDRNLEEAQDKYGIRSIRRWSLNYEMPDCRNDLIEQFDALSIIPSFVLWCDDDMIPPDGLLVKFINTLDNAPPEIVGVVAQSFSSHQGAPPPPGKPVVPCTKVQRIPSLYPPDWCFSAGGGFAFSLWRSEVFGYFKRPIFTRWCGEDEQFFAAIRKLGFFVRAFPEDIVGHCYVEKFRQKGRQLRKEWPGCHVVKRYEDLRGAVQQRQRSTEACTEEQASAVA